MPQSKNLALAFLFGAVLVGGALGFTADRMLSRDRHGDHALDMLDRRLDLSDAQRSQIDAILDDRHQQFGRVYETVKPKLDSIRLNAREQIRAVLSAEQRVQFEAILTELTDSTKRQPPR
jgi:Spy/CpxP family protein refolding chaperone